MWLEEIVSLSWQEHKHGYRTKIREGQRTQCFYVRFCEKHFTYYITREVEELVRKGEKGDNFIS